MPQPDFAAETKPWWRSRPAIVLGLLTVIYGVNYIDRQLIGLFAESIKRDLRITDSALGLLSGLAFALFYASLGLPMARLAQRIGRRTVIGLSVGVFALATTLSAAVGSFGQLFAARLIVGVGEAGTTPASLSIIAELYPDGRRARAMAIFTTGALVGLLIGFVLAAEVAGRFGWRAGFLVAGLPGLALSLAALKYLPHDGPRPTAPQRSIWPVLSGLIKDRAFLCLCIAGGASLFTSSAVSSWMPAYFQRAYHAGLPLTGLTFGGGIGVVGAVLTLASGRLADWLDTRRAGLSLLMVAGALLLALILYLAALYSGSEVVFIALVLPALGLSTVWQAPLLARVQGIVDPIERPTATAAFMLVTSLLGLALGPVVVGFLSDRLGHGSSDGLRGALAISVFANLVAIGFLFALRTHRDSRHS
jgi:predicted MFS family arabinose efflux permease